MVQAQHVQRGGGYTCWSCKQADTQACQATPKPQWCVSANTMHPRMDPRDGGESADTGRRASDRERLQYTVGTA